LDLAASYQWIQVYEVTPNCEVIRLDSRNRESDSGASAEANDVPGDCDSITSTEFYDFANNDSEDLLLRVIDSYQGSLFHKLYNAEIRLSRLDEEIQFMTKYFHNCWLEDRIPDSDVKDCYVVLRTVIETKHKKTKKILSSSFLRSNEACSKKRKRENENENGEITVDPLASEENIYPDTLDPILYFNLEGEVFSILRSTILRVTPESQLAARVSGRWEENEKDRDEEGNLIMYCHKESFRQILSSLQLSCYGSEMKVYVNALCRDFIEETLDYLLIVPDLLLYVN
jgi:hypothetical protein